MTEDIEYKISANRLNMFNACPKKLGMYLANYPVGPVEVKYINTGLAVHDLQEDRVKGIVKPPEDYMKSRNVPDDMVDTFWTCVETGKKFYDCGGIPEKTIIKHFVTPKGRKVRLEARLDLIADNSIWDYKTGKHADKPEYKLQGQVYHFATEFAYEKAKFISLQTGEIYEVPQPPKTYIPALCDRYIDTIESNEFVKKQTRLCEQYCDYYRWCMGDLQFVYVEDVRNDPEKYGMKINSGR